MKKFLISTTAFVALAAGGADAADIPLPVYKSVAPVHACAQFGGFYVGGHVGWAYHDWTWQDRDAWSGAGNGGASTAGGPSISGSKDGVTGGVQGGYNYQTGCTVLGLEADWSWTNLNQAKVNTDSGIGTALDIISVSSNLKSFGTLRTRTGVVVDSLLIYVTGGFAFAKIDRVYTSSDLSPPATFDVFNDGSTRWGWTAGVGTEWALTNAISIKSEVLYARFSETTSTFNSAVAFNSGLNPAVRFDNQDALWVTRIGVNYRFGR
jgi:outer membrane immunogenic protein